MEKQLAAFIMTYERSHFIGSTIHLLLAQSLPPEVILVVDNSISTDTERIIKELNNPLVKYVRVGYNSGPAGAAKIGLQWLTNEGYAWIYWGDDDDPPEFEDTFEQLLSITNQKTKKIGIIGAVGHYFKRQTGNIQRLPNVELFRALAHGMNFISVDSIAGNQSMIINSQLVNAGVLPDERLFFGFEELDFCLKAKTAGFDLFVSVQLFIRSREKHNRLNYVAPLYIQKPISELKREYYSVRNMLIILRFSGHFSAFIFQIVKNFVKMFYGFKFGWTYGKTNFVMIASGLFHGVFNITGRRK